MYRGAAVKRRAASILRFVGDTNAVKLHLRASNTENRDISIREDRNDCRTSVALFVGDSEREDCELQVLSYVSSRIFRSINLISLKLEPL